MNFLLSRNLLLVDNRGCAVLLRLPILVVESYPALSSSVSADWRFRSDISLSVKIHVIFSLKALSSQFGGFYLP